MKNVYSKQNKILSYSSVSEKFKKINSGLGEGRVYNPHSNTPLDPLGRNT